MADTNALILEELRMLRELVTALSGLVVALVTDGAPKDGLATVHEGEAVWPRIWPEPIGVDAVGQPIFPEAPAPEAGQSPSAQSGDEAPPQTPNPTRP